IHRAAASVPQQNRAAGQHAGLTFARWAEDFQGERAMGLRDSAIVAYAETKVMEKSDRDVWVLSGEILEELLDKTGVDKNEIDGLVMAGLSGTGAGNPFWGQTTAHGLGPAVGFCDQGRTRACSSPRRA